MADEKFGIENLQKVLSFGIGLGKSLVQEAKDGFNFNDVLQLLPQLSQIPEFIKNKQAIIDEAKDLSLPEIEALVKSVEGTIDNAKVVGIIEHALDVIVSAAALIGDFTKKDTPPAA